MGLQPGSPASPALHHSFHVVIAQRNPPPPPSGPPYAPLRAPSPPLLPFLHPAAGLPAIFSLPPSRLLSPFLPPFHSLISAHPAFRLPGLVSPLLSVPAPHPPTPTPWPIPSAGHVLPCRTRPSAGSTTTARGGQTPTRTPTRPASEPPGPAPHLTVRAATPRPPSIHALFPFNMLFHGPHACGLPNPLRAKSDKVLVVKDDAGPCPLF